MSKFINLDKYRYEPSENNTENDVNDISILSDEQKQAYDLFKKGENIFLTGPGGTGKTKLVQYFSNYARNVSRKYQVCAMTGCAAILLNCNARTLHSWSGIKLAKGESKSVIEKVLCNKSAISNWKRAKVLILDEVSMLSKKIFEIIEKLARIIRKIDLPFGGMQVVFCGDFCQLPPVGSYGEQDTFWFCFQSPLWKTVFPIQNHIVLKKIFRQNDPIYTNILQNIRKGAITKNDFNILKAQVNKQYDAAKHNDCVPTKLFPLRAKADYYNKVMYSQLEGEANTFELIKKADNILLENGKPIPFTVLEKCKKLKETEIEYEITQLINNCPCVQVLHLKIGAAVMCNVNLDMDNGICNGSQGVVEEIIKIGEIPSIVVKFSNGITKCIGQYYWQSEDYPTISIGQYPLCLCWALTIHKIQGATLDLAEIDVGTTVFEYGQTYVALSRVRSLDGLYLSAFEPEKIQTNPVVTSFYEEIDNLKKEVVLEKDISKDIKKIRL